MTEKERKEQETLFNKNSMLIITEFDGTEKRINIFGQEVEVPKYKKYVAEQDICLGSLMQPNNKIKSFEYRIPKKKWINN